MLKSITNALNFAELLTMAKSASERSKIAVAAAAEINVLASAKEAMAQGIADFIFVGDRAKILQLAAEVGLDAELSIIDAPDDEIACKAAVALVAAGEARALMKGICETSTIMKAVLDREHGIRSDKKLSHLAAFELSKYHKLLFITDAALNIAPDIETKQGIIKNAVESVQRLGIAEPKVALLAAKEKPDPKMPTTLEYVELLDIYKNGGIPGCLIDGPLALDNAISAKSAQIKGIDSPVAGDADILLCPNIEVANVLYKALTFFADSKSGGVILGAKRPIVLTSRADSSETKLLSIALSILC